MNQKDLKKALDKFRDVLLDNDACDHILSEYDGFHDLFSVFQKDYDLQVHVPHKQLSERIGQLERKINEGRAKVDGAEWLKNASEPATFVHYLQGRKDALEKELLEASK